MCNERKVSAGGVLLQRCFDAEILLLHGDWKRNGIIMIEEWEWKHQNKGVLL